MKKIKIAKKDEVMGYNTLFMGNYSVECLLDNEYVVPEEAIKDLKKNEISFKTLNNPKWLLSYLSLPPTNLPVLVIGCG